MFRKHSDVSLAMDVKKIEGTKALLSFWALLIVNHSSFGGRYKYG